MALRLGFGKDAVGDGGGGGGKSVSMISCLRLRFCLGFCLFRPFCIRL
jgi:hypothetical protein